MSAERAPEGARIGLASAALLVVSIIGSAVAAGTVHPRTLCVVSAILSLAATLAWSSGRPFRARPSATQLLAIGSGLTLFTALQLVPIPLGLLAKIASTNASIWASCLSPLGEPGPSFAPISLDPMATRIELLKGVAYLCAFLTTLRLASRRRGVAILEASLVASAVIVGLAALLHPLLNAQKLFGIYAPEADFGRHIAPLLNPNHLAGYLNIGFCIAVSIALRPQSGGARIIAFALALVLVGTQLWVASRGGVLAMLTGGVLVVWATRTRPSAAPRGRNLYRMIPGLAMLCGVAIAVLAASEEAWSELSVSSMSKLQLALDSLRVAPSFALFGAGRGAFESVYPAFRTDNAFIAYTHPENIVAQWGVEWGIVVSLVAACALVYGLRPSAIVGLPLVAGPWAAILAAALHNLVDFNSEVPAVGIALSVCAGILVGGSSSGRTSKVDKWGMSPRVVATCCGGTVALALVLLAPRLGDELHEDRLKFADILNRDVLTNDTFRATARDAMLRHPGEAYFPYAGATRSLRIASGDFLPWVSRALERYPAYGPAHLVLARWLRARSVSHARLEYRLALETTRNVSQIVAEAVPLLRNQNDVLEFAQAGVMTTQTLEALVPAVRARLPATVQLLDVKLAELSPENQGPLLRATEAAVRDVEPASDAPWCSRDTASCAHSASQLVQRLLAMRPRECAPHLLSARVASALGNTEDGLRDLSRAAEFVDDRRDCLMALVTMAIGANASAWVEDGIEKLSRSGCAGSDDCSSLYLYLANAEERRGNVRRALGLIKKAHDAWPENTAILSAVAARASALGMHHEAIEALTKLSVRDGRDPALDPSVAREKIAIEAERLRDVGTAAVVAP
jgi:tetratricopeptide (TPR) repeat protein